MSLGITPILAAALDDPHCTSSMYEWLADWQLQATELATDRDPVRAQAGTANFRAAGAALDDFEAHWRHGASRRSATCCPGVIELLGGPSPIRSPLARCTAAAVLAGRGPGRRPSTLGLHPTGIWAPECAFAPGMETEYAAAGVSHFMVDGPTLRGDTALGRPVGDTDVVAFGRDLTVSYRVWSPSRATRARRVPRLPTYDHDSGLKLSRVTGRTVAGPDKAPYDPDRVGAVIDKHVDDFIETIRARLVTECAHRSARPRRRRVRHRTVRPLGIEGPVWLERLLRRLPEAGVTVGSLSTARERGFVGAPVDLPASSWGSGKDWRCGPDPRSSTSSTSTPRSSARRWTPSTSATTYRPRPRPRQRPDPARDADDRRLGLAVHGVQDTAGGYATDRALWHAHAAREIADAAARGPSRPHSRWPTAGSPPTTCSPTSTRAGCRPEAYTDGVGDEATARLVGVSAGRGGRPRPPCAQSGRRPGELGHDVVVLTRRPTGTDATTHPTTVTTAEGVRIIAAAEDPPEFDFGSDMMPWTLAAGRAMVRAGLRVLRDDGTGQAWIPDVVHAHDWLVAHPAVALAEFYDVPLVATIHATEAGRHSGWVAAKTNRQVHSVEWWLAREADALITCSTSMRDEVNRLFGPELAEIQVIHNGIAVEEWPHRRLEESGTVRRTDPRNCCSPGDSSTKVCGTCWQRCHGSGAPIPGPR